MVTGKGGLVSVVMPAYNAERFIRQAIDSVIGQDYQNLELLVVDDGSTDGTARVVADYVRRDPRVRLLRQANAGVAAARNAGIAHARGEYIAPLDADDLWFPDMLALQVRRLSAESERVGAAYAWSVHVDEAGRPTGGYNAGGEEGDVYAALMVEFFIGNASATVFRRACFERCGGYDPTLRARRAEGCEDYDLHLRVARHFHFVRLPRLVVGYRQLTSSMSSSNWRRMARAHRFVFAALRRHHPTMPRALRRGVYSRFHRYYLAELCARANDARGQLLCLARAAAADARLLRNREFRQAVRQSLRGLRDGKCAFQTAQRPPPSLQALERYLHEHPPSVDARLLGFARACVESSAKGAPSSAREPGAAAPLHQAGGR
ncbi:glycosyltransferase family 2 protein [Ectothiorhodospiraceae bacterium 2226]|nr:glycosyltransferase family 2 protein [Ectothiorhodospiraceae bacterium 2226]